MPLIRLTPLKTQDLKAKFYVNSMHVVSVHPQFANGHHHTQVFLPGTRAVNVKEHCDTVARWMGYKEGGGEVERMAEAAEELLEQLELLVDRLGKVPGYDPFLVGARAAIAKAKEVGSA